MHMYMWPQIYANICATYICAPRTDTWPQSPSPQRASHTQSIAAKVRMVVLLTCCYDYHTYCSLHLPVSVSICSLRLRKMTARTW